MEVLLITIMRTVHRYVQFKFTYIISSFKKIKKVENNSKNIIFFITEQQFTATQSHNGKAGHRPCHVLPCFANSCFLFNDNHNYAIKTIFYSPTLYFISSSFKYKGKFFILLSNIQGKSKCCL